MAGFEPFIEALHDMQPSGDRIRKSRLLLVGPRVSDNDVIGGTQVQFELSLDTLFRRANVDLTVISTARPLADRGRVGKAFLDATAFLRTLVRLWRHAAAADLVVWFVSPRAAMLSGGFVWLVCAMRRRPLCIGFYGGGFDRQLATAPPMYRFIAARSFLKAELLLCQTRRLSAVLGRSFRTAWLPTTRDMPRRHRPYRGSCRRLLFLRATAGQGTSGADRGGSAVPVPGTPVGLRPAGAGDPGVIDRLPNAAYRGVAPPERVPAIMEDHDALVLPTRYANEGYPGVVIEAFQMGLPVIVARRPPLWELVTEGKDGLFVDVGSVDSLVDAVVRLCSDDGLFRRLRSGALESGERYRNVRAVQMIEELCRCAAEGTAAMGTPPRYGHSPPPLGSRDAPAVDG